MVSCNKSKIIRILISPHFVTQNGDGKMRQKVVGYMRTSTKTNVGENKDSDKRQLRTIKNFCKAQDFNLVETFYDKNISGTKPLNERPELLNAVDYCVENNIEIIVVEHSDRFARELVVQETIKLKLNLKNIRVICCDNLDFDGGTLFRQISGAINQHNKELLVERLRVSRISKREENYKKKIKTLQGVGKCEGAPQHYLNEDHNMIKIIKKLRNQDKWSYRQIAKYMNIEYGMVNQNDNMLHASQVKRIVEYKSKWR